MLNLPYVNNIVLGKYSLPAVCFFSFVWLLLPVKKKTGTRVPAFRALLQISCGCACFPLTIKGETNTYHYDCDAQNRLDSIRYTYRDGQTGLANTKYTISGFEQGGSFYLNVNLV